MLFFSVRRRLLLWKLRLLLLVLLLGNLHGRLLELLWWHHHLQTCTNINGRITRYLKRAADAAAATTTTMATRQARIERKMLTTKSRTTGANKRDKHQRRWVANVVAASSPRQTVERAQRLNATNKHRQPGGQKSCWCMGLVVLVVVVVVDASRVMILAPSTSTSQSPVLHFHVWTAIPNFSLGRESPAHPYTIFAKEMYMCVRVNERRERGREERSLGVTG